MNNDHTDPVHRSFNMYAQLLETGLSQTPQSKSTLHLLKRFENAQRQALMEFAEAETQEQLSRAESLLEAWLQTHSNMWKAAVEHDSLEALKSLRQLLSDLYYFREGEYSLSYQDTESRDAEEAGLDFSQYKQRLADNFRRRLTDLQFAAYAWAFYLSEEGDVSESTLRWVLIEPIAEDFGSVRALSEVFFRMRDTQVGVISWQGWNINRELDRNFGVATTGPATSTWILSFYCTTLVWVATRSGWVLSEDDDPQDSPALKYADRNLNLDPIQDTLESYKEQYPLESFLDDDPVVDGLIEYFEQVQNAFRQREREWTRTQSIDSGIVKRFTDKANSRLNDSTLRSALSDLNKITEVSDLDDEDTESFAVTGRYPRRLFVETGTRTVFTNNFSSVLTRYREFVIDHLQFLTQRVASYNKFPKKLDAIISKYDVELIITGDSESRSILRDHENSNRTSHDRLRSYLEYSNTPVLNDVGADFMALVLFKSDFKYEEASTATPLSIEYTAGEDVEEWQDANLPTGADPSDWVKFTLKYEAAIQSKTQNGIVLTL